MTLQRTRGVRESIGWLGGLVTAVAIAIAHGAAPGRATAQTTAQTASQAAERTALPRTLRDGAPARRFAGKAALPAKPAQPRPAATPAIVLDRGTLLGRAAMERRSMTLLQREIAVLQRLLANSPRADSRRADVLLRLAYAFQELMFQQKLRIHQLQEASGQECRCSLPADPGASAVACSAPPATAPVVAAR